MNQSVILTVAGSDRPGLTHAIADAVFAVGGNWLESHLSRLGGRYVGSVLVDVPQERLDDLAAAAQAIDETGLKVDIIAAVDGPDRGGQPLTIEIVGQDRPGIVREVANVLASLDVNIDALATAIEGSAWSGAPLFRATADLLIPAGVSTDQVRDALERISAEIMVDFSVQGAG